MTTTQELVDALLARRGADYYTQFSALMQRLVDDHGDLLAAALGATTSASSHSIGTGSKTFVLAADRPYAAGAEVVVARASAPATRMFCTVTANAAGSLTVNVTSTAGSGGPYTDWTVQVTGPVGPTGPTGSLPPATETVSGAVTLRQLRRVALRHALAAR